MKITFTVFFLSILHVYYSQKLKEIDTLTYGKMIDKEFAKSFKNSMDVKNYIASDKNTYKVGDTLILGTPSGINTTSFNVMGNEEASRRYEYIFYGTASGILLKGMRYVEETYKGYELVIDKIQFVKGALGTENYIYILGKPVPNKDFTIIDKYISITLFDKALESGEIYPLYKTRPLTRDEAIEILKKKKEELDLEIITKEEYDKYKNELSDIIKNSK